MATKEDMMARAKADYEAWRNSGGDYQSRFCYELVELRDRVKRLEKYLIAGCPQTTTDLRKARPMVQLCHMRAYLCILELRYEDDHL